MMDDVDQISVIAGELQGSRPRLYLGKEPLTSELKSTQVATAASEDPLMVTKQMIQTISSCKKYIKRVIL